VRHLVLRLVLVTAAAAIAAVTATALVVHVIGERDRLRSGSEADLAALVSLAETTSDREALLRGIARTAAGREGRLAVHVGGTTVGSSRLEPALVRPPAELGVPGGRVLFRRAGAGTVEVFVPALAPGTAELGLGALLLGVGALAAGVGAVAAARRVRPVVADLAALAARADAIGREDPPPEPPPAPDTPAPPDTPPDTPEDPPPEPAPTHVPETAALADALTAVTARFAAARDLERRIAADLSHRLRTPLTVLTLDADAIGGGPAAERVRATVAALERDVDALISPAPAADAEAARCDVAEVVKQRMRVWSLLAQFEGRQCELSPAQGPAMIALAEDDLGAVLDALLHNVFTHTLRGTAFAVAVVRHAGWVTLVVDDAGPGVADPAAALKRGVTTDGGTGLGLDIARDAVETTGGTIHIERAALGGARIRLRFAEADTAHDAHEPRAWRMWRTGGRVP
jgi:signal transduction histidine kinase